MMATLKNLSALAQPVPEVSLDGVARGRRRQKAGTLGSDRLVGESPWKTRWAVNAIDPFSS